MPVKISEAPAASETARFISQFDDMRMEKRRRARLPVHWAVRLFRGDPATVTESTTRDVSSNGFYCVCTGGFTLDEPITCVLLLPTHDPEGRVEVCALQCRAHVVRIEPSDREDLQGVAFSFDEFSLAGATPRGKAQPAGI